MPMSPRTVIEPVPNLADGAGTRPLVVVGGGIVGLAVARRALADPGAGPVLVLDKESHVASHQTGHNSGVVHAGLYYAPGSLKARLCTDGRQRLRSYCAERGIAYDECGKVVVATDATELDRLDEILRRSLANGVPGVRRIDAAELHQLEPHVAGVAAVHSPETAIVDFTAVAEAYAADVVDAGGEVRCGWKVVGLRDDGRRVEVEAEHTASGARHTISASSVVVCAGLQTDLVARLAGDDVSPAIVPFRGEYHALRADRRHLVKGLIYPVPDPRYPFLGVHLTKRIDGEILVGPNAVLALAREGYRWRDVSVADLRRIAGYRGFWALARQHWRTGARELRGSVTLSAFVAEARRYVPELQTTDVVPAGSGVRAQAVGADGSMVDDFVINHHGRVIAVRNAPSPAATSSLAIADHIWDAISAAP
jgi:(S)-2-hydroxyglutarate dehydrogenase